MDRDQLKSTFHRVTAYRQICQAVRSTANGTLFHGLIFACFAFLLYRLTGLKSPIVIVCAVVALIEFAVGFWKKWRPSIECILVDSINSAIFGGAILARFALAHFGVIGRNPDIISLVLSLWVLFSAWSQFKNYRMLLRMFPIRPTREQLTYVDGMVRDLRQADPATDPAALDLPGPPRVRALLADELIFLLDDVHQSALVLDRSDVTLRRVPGGSGEPARGLLTINGQTWAPFPLSEENWRNYLRWKGETAEIE